METAIVNKLTEYVTELYSTHAQRFIPLYPWVLVRVLPKAQKKGELWLPDKHNKVLYEGVVLKTWEPFWKNFRTRTESRPANLSKNLGGTIVETTEKVEMRSELKVCDFVMFPHYAGLPVSFLDAKEYRIVKEDASLDDKSTVCMKVEHKFGTLEKELKKLGLPMSAIVNVLKNYNVIPKSDDDRPTALLAGK